MASGVYKIVSPTGRIYIGQTNNIKRRIIEHRYNSKRLNTKLYSSIKKYGLDNHNISMIFYSDVQHERDAMEMFYISYYKSIDLGLNHMISDTPCGAMKGKKHTKEVVDGIKKRMKGVKPTWAIEKKKVKIYSQTEDMYFESTKKCSEYFNVSQPLISMMINGKRENRYNLKRA